MPRDYDIRPIQYEFFMTAKHGGNFLHRLNHLQIGFPHITTHILQLLRAWFAQPAEEPQQCFGRPLFSNPQQPYGISVDLINDRYVTMPFAPAQFIGAF